MFQGGVFRLRFERMVTGHDFGFELRLDMFLDSSEICKRAKIVSVAGDEKHGHFDFTEM